MLVLINYIDIKGIVFIDAEICTQILLRSLSYIRYLFGKLHPKGPIGLYFIVCVCTLFCLDTRTARLRPCVVSHHVSQIVKLLGMNNIKYMAYIKGPILQDYITHTMVRLFNRQQYAHSKIINYPNEGRNLLTNFFLNFFT